MAYLGMLMLGVFVGAILTLGIGTIDGFATFAKLVTTVLAAAFSGVVMSFIDGKYGTSLGPAKFMYPVGLAIMVPWFYMKQIMDLVRSPDRLLKGVGIAGLVAVAAITIVAAALVLPPAFRDAWHRPE